MAQDFIALIEGRADLSSAQKAFDAFKKQVQQPIKITFDTGGLNTTFNAINKQAEQQGAQMASAYARGFQGNIRGAKLSSSLETILYKGGKLDLGDAGILNVNRSALKELEALPGVYKAIEKELDSIGAKGTQLKSLNFNDTGTSFTAKLSNGLNTTITLAGTLTAKMNEAGEAVGQWVTTQSYMTDFTNSEKQAQAEAEKLATSLQKVKDAFTANDSFSSTFKSMESELANIGSTVSTDTIQRATQAAEQYKSIIQEIQATLNGTATNPLSDAQVVEKYKEAQMALTQYKNVMTEVRIEQKSMITEAKANQNADAVQKWCNNNSKALKKYGAELEDIQQKMRTTFDAKGQAELQQQAKQIFAKAGAEGLLGKSFGDEIKRAFTRIGEFTGIYYVASKLRQVPQQMVSEVIKIDTAMTELRKVSTASASEISDYFDRATDSAYKYGQAINEVIDSTASWTRLGYNLEDASILTDVTAELAKVGAGLNTQTATEGLQAIIRGFGFAADEAKRVADAVNEVSDASPIDALGIIQGLERSSAVLRETNNTLEESIGLITATTATTQDATAAGTAWRTVALRIANAKAQLEEAGLDTEGMVSSTAELQELMLKVAGINILDETGRNFKSTYQIMSELAKVWGQLDQVSRQSLLDKIAGKRGSTAVSSALQNWSIAEAAKNQALNAEGSMDRQLEVYNQSIQASLDRFHVAFQQLATDFISSGFIKGVVDAGTEIVKIIDAIVKNIGVLGTALTALGIAKIFGTINAGVKSVDTLAVALGKLPQTATGIEKIGVIFTNLGLKATGASTALGSLGSSLLAFLSNPVTLGVGAAVATVAGIALAIKKQQDDLNKQATNTTNSWKSSQSEIDNYKDKYTELNEKLNDANLSESERIGIKRQLLDLQNEIVTKYGDQVSGIDLVNGKLETQLGILSKITAETAKQNLRDNYDAYQQSVKEMEKSRKYTVSNGNITGGMYKQFASEEMQNQIASVFTGANFTKKGDGFKFTGDATEFNSAVNQVLDGLEDLKDGASETDKAILQNAINSAQEALLKNKEVLDKYQENYQAYLQQSLFAEGFGDELSEYARRTQEYNDALLSGNMDKIVEAKSQLDEYQTTVDGILGEHPEYGDFFNEIADSVNTTTEAVMNFKDIIDDGVAESTNGLKDYADVIRDTVNRVKKMELDPVDVEQILLNGGEGFDALSQLAKLFNKDFDFTNRDQVRGFADILAQLGVVADETAQEVDLSSASFTDFMHYASDSIDAIDKVNSALVNSFASGGLSAGIDKDTGALTGDVAEIIKAYSGLDGFDVANIFERTAKGVIVNRDALRELQKQQEDTLKDEFATRMSEAWNEWKKAVETGDIDNASYWKTQYENVNLLASAYDGATSAYQRWLDAQKMGEAGDMYDTVAKTALKRGKELYDSGLVGTNEFRAIAQLYSDLDLSTASVDELTAAYESGYETVKKYFTKGQEGAVAFADKITELGYATKDAEGNYDFFNGIDTEAVAHDLGISVDLVEAAFNKLGDYGFDIHFNFDDGQSAIMQFKQRLDELNSEEVSPDVFVDDTQLREIAEYLLNLDDEEIDTEFNITNEDTVDSLIDKLSQKYNVQATVSADNSTMPSTMSTVIDAAVEINQNDIRLADQKVHVEPEPNPLEVVAKLDSTEVDNYKPKDHNPTVTYHKKSEEVDNYNPPNFNRNVNYSVNVSGTGALNAIPADGTTRDVYVNVHTNQMYTGTVSKSAFQGMSHARGTVGGRSHASGLLGKVGLKSNENALINELGPEIVVRPSEDSWMIFNDGKPTFASLKKDDVIFNADLSRQLLQNGKADDYAKLLGGSYAGGTVRGYAHVTEVKGGGHFGGGNSTTKHKDKGDGGGGGGDNGSKGSNNNSTKEAKDFSEVLDEIEIKIDRVERSINNLDTIASSTFNGTTQRITALNRELKKTSQEIDIQKAAYKRYMLEANKYANGLDPKLLEEVKNGNIDIKTIKDEDVWKKIENFRKYYEAALSARDAVYKLQAQEADLWTQRFNIAQTAYDNKIAQYQHMIDMMDSYISEAESRGRITANKYREKQITEERKKLQDLNKEQTNLMKKMTDALKNGMAVGSEAYYEMLEGINSVSEAIVESNANIAELQKSIRETDWEIFDRASDAIANMRDELEFIYGLLGEDLYDKKGNVTDNGIAGFGILASQYNFAMVESQRYAEEIKKINAEIAKDPLNQDLIDRRQDLYESQRDAIKQANDYKESIRDLVKEGIELQIDSMKELIQNYEDLLDAQKDEMDYSKRVTDQQSNINRLQKQLNAYANDDSEEGAARRQKLRNELKTAQENLQQTQEERRISQTKKMLSDLQEDYENVLNARLDDLEALVKAVTDGVNKNSAKISEAINVATANVGYTVTHEMQTMLSGGKDLVSYFLGGRFINELTKAIAVASNIEKGISNTVSKTNKEQSKTVSQTTKKEDNTQAEVVKAQNYKNKVTGTDGKWLQDSNKQRIGWQFNDGTKATGWSKIDNDWYYFNKKGKIRAGLQKIGNYNYFLKRYGGRAESEWVKVGTKWYYFDKDGHALTGWHEIEKDGTKGWRYFNPNTAAMATNAWVKNSSKDGVYYVNGSGIMVKNGKYETKDGWRTFDKNGKWKGYRLGTKSVGANGLYWTNEGQPETIIRKTDGAVLTKLNAGDTVFNSDATNTMWDFANDPMKFLRSLGYTGGTFSAGNDVDLVINLSGLRSPSEFMDALRRDKKFEKFIQEITIGRVSGHGVLAKNAIAF